MSLFAFSNRPQHFSHTAFRKFELNSVENFGLQFFETKLGLSKPRTFQNSDIPISSLNGLSHVSIYRFRQAYLSLGLSAPLGPLLRVHGALRCAHHGRTVSSTQAIQIASCFPENLEFFEGTTKNQTCSERPCLYSAMYSSRWRYWLG